MQIGVVQSSNGLLKNMTAGHHLGDRAGHDARVARARKAFRSSRTAYLNALRDQREAEARAAQYIEEGRVTPLPTPEEPS